MIAPPLIVAARRKNKGKRRKKGGGEKGESMGESDGGQGKMSKKCGLSKRVS